MKFEKGEKVLKEAVFQKEKVIGVVKDIVERPELYKVRYEYLIEWQIKGVFKEYKKEEWVTELSLCKFVK